MIGDRRPTHFPHEKTLRFAVMSIALRSRGYSHADVAHLMGRTRDTARHHWRKAEAVMAAYDKKQSNGER